MPALTSTERMRKHRAARNKRIARGQCAKCAARKSLSPYSCCEQCLRSNDNIYAAVRDFRLYSRRATLVQDADEQREVRRLAAEAGMRMFSILKKHERELAQKRSAARLMS
jgi:hypothetical protein